MRLLSICLMPLIIFFQTFFSKGEMLKEMDVFGESKRNTENSFVDQVRTVDDRVYIVKENKSGFEKQDDFHFELLPIDQVILKLEDEPDIYTENTGSEFGKQLEAMSGRLLIGEKSF